LLLSFRILQNGHCAVTTRKSRQQAKQSIKASAFCGAACAFERSEASDFGDLIAQPRGIERLPLARSSAPHSFFAMTDIVC
jgi:hypothetical protein